MLFFFKEKKPSIKIGKNGVRMEYMYWICKTVRILTTLSCCCWALTLFESETFRKCEWDNKQRIIIWKFCQTTVVASDFVWGFFLLSFYIVSSALPLQNPLYWHVKKNKNIMMYHYRLCFRLYHGINSMQRHQPISIRRRNIHDNGAGWEVRGLPKLLLFILRRKWMCYQLSW